MVRSWSVYKTNPIFGTYHIEIETTMLRIRAVQGGSTILSEDRVAQTQEIFRQAFPNPDMSGYAGRIPDLLRDPIEQGYQTTLLTAERSFGRVDGFALLIHFPQSDCAFLDFIAVRPNLHGSGIGGALYEATRECCRQMGAHGLYLEVDPDEPEHAVDTSTLEQARKRIRFYEQYGVRVVYGTDYATPVGDPPTRAYLLFDGLDRTEALSRSNARKAVEMILARRFGHIADPSYRKRVVASFRDDPVRFRPLLDARQEPVRRAVLHKRLGERFAMIVTPRHEIHHIRDRGYFERPARVHAIEESLANSELFARLQPREHGDRPILAVHDAQYVKFLRTVSGKIKEGRPFYPDTFPIRRPDRQPKMVPDQAGFYCIDTGTPLYHQAFVAAKAAANTSVTAAEELLAGRRLSYAVCRPPGHHAGANYYGGFCYFNNAAIAAQFLRPHGRIAILDIDYHHGNGTQDIFYERSDVLTVSIHGDPDGEYPYFSGFAREIGEYEGAGCNRNYPLPPGTDNERYLRTFARALGAVTAFKPEILIVSLGFDTLKGDPTGTFTLTPAALHTIGKRLMQLRLPVLVVQEGGYNVRNIRLGSSAFFNGCGEGV